MILKRSEITEAEAEGLYEKWSELPDGKISLLAENMWCKKLPNGLIALNNNPLNGGYRWQDILDDEHRVIYRRWNFKVPFQYSPLPTEEADAVRRKEIYEALKDLGAVSFFVRGVGSLLSRIDV